MNPPQYIAALEQAQGVRLRKAQTKKMIAREEVDPATIALESSIPFRVGELLVSIKGMGEVKARKLCREYDLPWTSWVTSSRAPMCQRLTQRQREVLASAIDEFVLLRGKPNDERIRLRRELAA